MSRSVRRQPFAVLCGRSQKQDKRICNRCMRRANRVALLVHGPEALFMRHAEALDRYAMSQDGTRHYAPWPDKKWPGSRLSWLQWFRWVKTK